MELNLLKTLTQKLSLGAGMWASYWASYSADDDHSNDDHGDGEHNLFHLGEEVQYPIPVLKEGLLNSPDRRAH